jgi:hypothetical protein
LGGVANTPRSIQVAGDGVEMAAEIGAAQGELASLEKIPLEIPRKSLDQR